MDLERSWFGFALFVAFVCNLILFLLMMRVLSEVEGWKNKTIHLELRMRRLGG